MNPAPIAPGILGPAASGPRRPPLLLVSHALCPYVQRAAIVLAEKGIDFERRDIDLADKPAWFLAVSPLGKTPVLLVGGEPLFESAAICEYLEELQPQPPLHPQDARQRARERGWMEFGSATLAAIANLYNAADEAQLDRWARDLEGKFAQLEGALHPSGPWFAGERFGFVDAAFGPVFRYLDAFDAAFDGFGWLQGRPRLARWRRSLAGRASVQGAATPGYAKRLQGFLRARDSALSKRMPATGG
jgi:glutathione S-transferase